MSEGWARGRELGGGSRLFSGAQIYGGRLGQGRRTRLLSHPPSSPAVPVFQMQGGERGTKGSAHFTMLGNFLACQRVFLLLNIVGFGANADM